MWVHVHVRRGSVISPKCSPNIVFQAPVGISNRKASQSCCNVAMENNHSDVHVYVCVCVFTYQPAALVSILLSIFWCFNVSDVSMCLVRCVSMFHDVCTIFLFL